jgi:hypothetical protein
MTATYVWTNSDNTSDTWELRCEKILDVGPSGVKSKLAPAEDNSAVPMKVFIGLKSSMWGKRELRWWLGQPGCTAHLVDNEPVLLETLDPSRTAVSTKQGLVCPAHQVLCLEERAIPNGKLNSDQAFKYIAYLQCDPLKDAAAHDNLPGYKNGNLVWFPY